VTQRYRRLNPLEPGVRSERVNVTAAGAAGSYPERHLSGIGSDGLYVLDASCSGLIARFYESFHPHAPRVPSPSGVRLFKGIPDGGFRGLSFREALWKGTQAVRIYESSPSR
jgi:hypothetical protein